jgi:ribosomal protein S17
MKEDLAIMAANFESFTAVVTMVSKAVAHSASIYNDAYKAYSDYDAHQMIDFGKDLGDIVRVVLVHKLA